MAIRKLKARGIGRFELLSWLNEFLETDYTKIEHLADGIAYCQVFDLLYPGKVPLQQVNFHAQVEPEYERNLKLLQRALETCGVHKEMAIKKLVRGVFQEHFEFLHWVHDYVHRTYPDAMRIGNAYARREQIFQKSGAVPVNLNLIPTFSMRNGLFRQSVKGALLQPENYKGGSMDPVDATEAAALVEADVDKGCLDVVARSWTYTVDALQRATHLIRTLEAKPTPIAPTSSKSSRRPKTKAGGVEAKHGPVAASKKKQQRTLTLLQLLNASLEAELHGRIKDLDALQAEVSVILTERKHFFELLREVEMLCTTQTHHHDTSSDFTEVLAILASPFDELPGPEETAAMLTS
ncbi:hypothetical protein, variant 1 [Aphanomyces invadans]|uniref:Calponin-homology (CH) domain-containing protein n=1 Tax=Aphanomyces invadans TaxID=157072 RepID=A0A024UFP2_9STRA|nr:hypothetical protein, variant 1 [Aphanomyces invadans]ETW05104.1 hypothetical protein, variant 1 [Aphanomyces invadans]|eukprot:XP_008866542.1 hypothetical protein, variant 1 [Aphanomyces invadans]